MSATVTTQRGSDPAEPITPMARVDPALHLSPRTVAWLADHPQARQFVGSVWGKLASWSDPVSTPVPSTHCGGS